MKENNLIQAADIAVNVHYAAGNPLYAMVQNAPQFGNVRAMVERVLLKQAGKSHYFPATEVTPDEITAFIRKAQGEIDTIFDVVGDVVLSFATGSGFIRPMLPQLDPTGARINANQFQFHACITFDRKARMRQTTLFNRLTAALQQRLQALRLSGPFDRDAVMVGITIMQTNDAESIIETYSGKQGARVVCRDNIVDVEQVITDFASNRAGMSYRMLRELIGDKAYIKNRTLINSAILARNERIMEQPVANKRFTIICPSDEIAMEGAAGSGKSTFAKFLALHEGFAFDEIWSEGSGANPFEGYDCQPAVIWDECRGLGRVPLGDLLQLTDPHNHRAQMVGARFHSVAVPASFMVIVSPLPFTQLSVALLNSANGNEDANQLARRAIIFEVCRGKTPDALDNIYKLCRTTPTGRIVDRQAVMREDAPEPLTLRYVLQYLTERLKVTENAPTTQIVTAIINDTRK